MDVQQRGRTVGVALGVAAMAALLYGLYSAMGAGEPQSTVSGAGLTEGPVSDEGDGLGLDAVAGASGQTRSSDASERSLESDVSAEAEGAQGAEQPEFLALVEVAENPWLWNRGIDVTFAFGGVSYEVLVREREGRIVARNPTSLAGDPGSPKAYSNVTIAGLEGEVVRIEPPPEGGALVHRLVLGLPDLIAVRWGPSSRDPSLVSVAIGGTIAPPSRRSYSHSSRDGLVLAREGLSLPLLIPRPAAEEALWVGAGGFAWRSFPIGPSTVSVDVVLERGGTIRVLHDGPVPGEERTAVVTALPLGERDMRRIEGDEPIVFTDRPDAVHQVWIADGDALKRSSRVSRQARIEVGAGETVEVDLTAAHAARDFGACRVAIRVPADALARARGELKPRLSREAPPGARYPWQSVGDLVRAGKDETGLFIFERTGLEPGRHRVRVSPFGFVADFRASAGTTEDVFVDVSSMGWAAFVDAEQAPRDPGGIRCWSASDDPSDRFAVFGSATTDPSGVQCVALSPGTYTAETSSAFNDEVHFQSEAFTVHPGQTTVVALNAREACTLELSIVDDATDEVLAPDLAFWVAVGVIGAETGQPYVSVATFSGDGAIKGMTITLLPMDEAVRLEIPESPFWTFIDPGELSLAGAEKLVLRANPK